MHPVNYLFEDIYRKDWSIASVAANERRRNRTNSWKRVRFALERKRG